MLDGPTPLQILEDPGSFGAYQIGQVAPELFLLNRTIDDLGWQKASHFLDERFSDFRFVGQVMQLLTQ